MAIGWVAVFATLILVPVRAWMTLTGPADPGSPQSERVRWRFRPTSFVPGMGGVAAMVRLFVGGRSRARRYLALRGLVPPEIRWDQINAIKRQIKAEHAARSPTK